ncbi:MAG: hypothetical protein P4M08_00985 [Oligoflexia bacterium]|nr:hypothetical protein [Oligoflexia bacterium]
MTSEPTSPNSLTRSLNASVSDLALPHSALPRIQVSGETTPQARIARSIRGNGTISISRGLLSLLNEEELQAVLREAFDRLQSRGILRATCCATWAEKLGKRAGIVRTDSRPLTPLQLLIGWMALPAFRILTRQAVKVSLLTRAPNDFPSNVPDALKTALRKASRVTEIHRARLK